ncbi:hypothetical protein AMEX_G61 [Astyanax mexicanus]|uniref:Uncharacterized protein n=1 Tax=Astyanax mexicanus TaxID=7994 RepID=A0A8T2MAV8_ASTMX|nr:hypothetical protein AMEX_G61 [Astyanax mexicanus]
MLCIKGLTSKVDLSTANINEDQLAHLSRDDIRDLLPGPEHFFRRKAIWRVGHQEEKQHPMSDLGSSDAESSTSCSSGASTYNTPGRSPSKVMKMPGLEYALYTDSELEQARKYYFQQQLLGKEQECSLSKELRCRLIRNTVTNMISVTRATVKDFTYPSKRDVIAMAKRLVEYFPMLRDRSVLCKYEWETISRLLMKRLQNVRTPRKSRSSEDPSSSPGVKNKGPKKGRHLEFGSGSVDNRCTMANDCDTDSSGSTVLLDKSSFRASTSESSEHDEALQQSIDLLKGLPVLFPSGVAPPKKLGQPSEALFHILTPSENAAAFLSRFPLSCF